MNLLAKKAFYYAKNSDRVGKEKVAGVALRISHEIETLQEALDGLKEILRGHARRENQLSLFSDPKNEPRPESDAPNGSYRVPIKGVSDKGEFLGEVTVTFGSPFPTLSRLGRRNLTELRKLLGEELFSTLFESRTGYSPRKDIYQTLRELPEEISLKVSPYLDMDEPTPRVGFKVCLPPEDKIND